MEPKYKRILLKVSGEVLAGDKKHGFDFDTVNSVCAAIKEMADLGTEVAIVVGGCRDALKSYYQTTFKYSSDVGMGWEDYGFYGRYTVPIEADKEGFYGELDGVIPEKDKNVEISTKRVSYAAKFIAQNLSEGTLDIAVKRPYFGGQHTDYISLTPSSLTSDKIYSFANAHQAWKGIYKGTDSDTGEPIYENYSSKKTLEIKWNKGDGTVIPFGIYSVTFKRNVKTTICINVADLPSVSNGITVTKEETTITDDENEYNISGGKIVEVPVTSEP